jgi:hypothetical protein
MPRSHPIPDEQPVTFRDYSVFGLRVRSEIPLPELFEAGPGDADVTICLGEVPVVEGNDIGLAVAGGALFLHIFGIARFRISGGDTVVVDPEPGVPDGNVRLYLLGSAFGALLHQRGILPLHANAIEVDGKAVAFMGASGAGKSTLAAWFHDRGHRVAADDVCVVRFGAKTPFVSPGLPRLRLWLEALEAMGREPATYARSYAGRDLEKFDVPVARETSAGADLALGAVYLLDRGERFAIHPLAGIEAAEAAYANTYRGQYIGAAKGYLSHWAACVQLVQSTPIYCLKRPWGLDRLDSDCERVLQHLRSGSSAINVARQA